jgi:hypothetical protein
MSIKLYYTGASNASPSQPDPNISLGGVISTTEIPNDRMNSIFGDIASVPRLGFESEYRGIAIKNETGGNITNMEFYIEQPPATPYATFEVAFVSVIEDPDCPGVFSFEKINDHLSKPYVGTFVSPDSGAPGIIASFPNDTYLGVWIRRIIDPAAVSEGNSCATLLAQYNSDNSVIKIAESIEEFELSFTY